MASINLKGYLRETLGALSAGNKIRFTHATTTGETIAGSVTNYIVADDGYYDINIEYGNVFIETSDKDSRSWQAHGTTTINASTAATTLPTLLNSVVPPTDAQILLFQNLVADAENARDASEASAVRSETAAQTSIDNTILMTASEHDAILVQNEEKYAASGMVNMGKGRDGSPFTSINEGLYTKEDASNILYTGSDSSVKVGTSKTDFAVSHIAGAVSELVSLDSTHKYQILLPPAPDGTVTFNSSTGAIVTHADVATAFAAAAAAPDVEVVTDRVDMFGLEQFDMVIKDDEVFDMVQSQSTTFGDTDVPTVDSVRPDSFFAVYDGQTGITKGKCVKWSTLTDVQKRKVAAYMKERLWVNEDGDLTFTTIRQRSFAGAGNGDWYQLQPTASGSSYDIKLNFAASNNASVAQQGDKDEPVGGSSIGTTSTNFYSPSASIDLLHKEQQGCFVSRYDNTAYKGRCFFYVLGTVSRLNQGAYYPGLNESGARAFCADALSATREWNHANIVGAGKIKTKADCFDIRTNEVGYAAQNSGYIGSSNIGSGRSDGRFYDAIYADGLGGVVDYRLSAYAMSSPEESAKAWEKVKNGTYRGLEKLVWTQVFAAVGDVPSGWIIQNSDNPAAIVAYMELNTSVSGNFTMTTQWGEPAKLLTAFPNGFCGVWGGLTP